MSFNEWLEIREATKTKVCPKCEKHASFSFSNCTRCGTPFAKHKPPKIEPKPKKSSWWFRK
jgi:predicted amidophosphoribosyltransferase